MDPARIAELLAPFLGTLSANDQRPFLACPERSEGPNDALYQHISTYIDILLRWNARINLTAIRDPEQIVTRHFGESLFAAGHLFPRTHREGHGLSRGADRSRKDGALSPEANDQRPFLARPERSEGTNNQGSLADLGSGAGFPGIPIKFWAPGISLTLIESSHRKSAFLREVTRVLTLTDVNIRTARAEALDQTFDVVTLRAVERFEHILPTAARLVAPGGRLALLIGTAQVSRVHSILPRFTWEPALTVPQSRSRTVLIGVGPATADQS